MHLVMSGDFKYALGDFSGALGDFNKALDILDSASQWRVAALLKGGHCFLILVRI